MIPRFFCVYRSCLESTYRKVPSVGNFMNQTTYFRPRWTCGRYHVEKHVAIMYNLLAGYSFFFENYSADVIGVILSIPRDGELSVAMIAQQTGIAEESIRSFCETLCQQGLLTVSKPTDPDVQHYREQLYHPLAELE